MTGDIMRKFGPMSAVALGAIATVLLVGGVYVWRVGSPDRIIPDEKFELQFGRGSGWHGLDLLRITSDGNAWYEYQEILGEWQRKRFHVGAKQIQELREAIDTLDLWELARSYHADVADGTQWCLL